MSSLAQSIFHIGEKLSLVNQPPYKRSLSAHVLLSDRSRWALVALHVSNTRDLMELIGKPFVMQQDSGHSWHCRTERQRFYDTRHCFSDRAGFTSITAIITLRITGVALPLPTKGPIAVKREDADHLMLLSEVCERASSVESEPARRQPLATLSKPYRQQSKPYARTSKSRPAMPKLDRGQQYWLWQNVRPHLPDQQLKMLANLSFDTQMACLYAFYQWSERSRARKYA